MNPAITLGIDFGDRSCKVAINATNIASLDELDVLFVGPAIPSLLTKSEHDAQAQAFANVKINIGSLKHLLALDKTKVAANNTSPDSFVFKEMETGDMGVEKIVALVSSIAQATVNQVVVTIPDWFSDASQRSMIHALEMSGLKNFKIIPQSTAFHIDYVVTNLPIYGAETTHNVVLIDIGHIGTTMCVLSVIDGILKTQSAVSYPSFGGQIVDYAILRSLSKETLVGKQQLLSECQRAKEALHMFNDMDEGLDIASSGTLNGKALYELVGLSHHIPDLVKTLLEKAGLETDQVNKVVLTGGTMRLLQVRDCISSLFPPGIIEVGSHITAARGALYASLVHAGPGLHPNHPILSGLLPGFISTDSPKFDMTLAGTHAPLLRSLSLDTSQYVLTKDATQVANRHSIYSSEVTIDEPLQSQIRLVEMTPENHIYAPLYMDKCASLLVQAFDSSKQRINLTQAIHMQTKATSLSKSLTDMSKYLNNLALLLQKQYNLDNDLSVLNYAITNLQHAEKLAADDHPQKSKFLSNLSNLCYTKYEKTRDFEDLDSAVEAKKKAINLLGKESAKAAPHLNLYALLLEDRFERQGNIADLTEGIAALDGAVNMPLRGDVEHALHFNLGVLLQKLYDRNKALSDLDRSIKHQRKAVACAPDGSIKSMYLNHLGDSLQTLFIKRWNLEDLTSAIECHRNAANLVDDNDPKKAFLLNSVGKSLGLYFSHQKSVPHLDDAIVTQQSAVDLTGMRHPNKGLYLRNLAMLLERRYEDSSNISDLERAIESRKIASTLMPPPKADHLTSLVDSFYTKYKVTHELSDLEQAIANMRKVTDMTPDFMQTKIDVLEKLAAYLSKAYDDHGNLSHLQEVISVQQEILELADEDTSDLHRHLFHLGSNHRSRFDRLGKESDLSNAVSLLKQAIDKCDEKHPRRPNYLNHLGSALHHQHLLSPDTCPLSIAIEYLRKAIESSLDDEEKISFTNNLAISLLGQFDISQDAHYLYEAIESYQMVADLTPHNHPNKASRLNNLGIALRQKFNYSGQIEDLNNSIETLKAAASTFSHDSTPSQSRSYIASLGTAFSYRYKYFGAIKDIDEAIAYQQSSLDALPDDSIEKAGHHSNLGKSYLSRYESYGELYDLNRAIVCQRIAVSETPDGHAHLPLYLDGLASCLRKRMFKHGTIEDLKEAISYQEKAVSLTPKTHIHRPGYLSNLGVSMIIYFNVTKDASYLDIGITHYQMAASLIPDDFPLKAEYLMDLGAALQKRGKAASQVSDLNQAIAHLERAIELTPQAQSIKGRGYHILGDALYAKFLLESQSEDLQRATQAFTLAAQHENGKYSSRFGSAVAWVRCAKENSDPSLKLAYSTLLEILPYLAWIGLSVEAQMEESMIAQSTGCDAAAAAIQLEDKSDKSKSFDLALEWLEQGRSIFWNRILQLRLPFDKLKDINPVLAGQIQDISSELDQHRASGSDLYTTTGYWRDPNSEKHFKKQHDLAKQLEELMMQVQNSPEMYDAIDKATATDLKQCASAGIIVVVNMSELQCDALIIQSPELPVLHLSLNEFSRQQAEKLQKHLSSLVDSPFGMREDAERHGGLVYKRPTQTSDDSFRYILRELWLKVVKPIVDLLQLRTQNDISKLPHIYWCPTGPLTFLPLHAAGLYGTSAETETLFQYAVSSYIPNLRTLCTIVKKQKQRTRSNQIRMLAVTQPETPGHNRLPGTLEELKFIHDHTVGHHLSVLNGPQGTRQEVMAGLDSHSWIHLSCHGIQHLTVPAYSGLALHDGMLSILDLIKKPLPQAEFAFLAACQTATGDSIQFDEAVHLAGGLLVAGFSSVIATMWSVRDNDGPEMTDKVYKHLFSAEQPDIRQSAYALHNAIQHLRSKYYDNSFTAWVPYIHMGL